MVRTLFVCALLLTLPCTSRAQKSQGSMETLVQLLVQPMAVPRPALKYQLLPELAEMNPGDDQESPGLALLKSGERHSLQMR